MVSESQIRELITKAMPSAVITCYDMTGGGDHWQVKVRAEEFRTCSMIEQHQMIYRALGRLMDKDIHALSLDTGAP